MLWARFAVMHPVGVVVGTENERTFARKGRPLCLVSFGFRSLVLAAQSKVYFPSPGEMVKIERDAFSLERKRKACCLRDGLFVLHGSIF